MRDPDLRGAGEGSFNSEKVGIKLPLSPNCKNPSQRPNSAYPHPSAFSSAMPYPSIPERPQVRRP